MPTTNPGFGALLPLLGAAYNTDTMEREIIETAMPTAKQLTIETVNLNDEREMDEFDRQVIAAGMERVRAEIKDLRQKGLLDALGKPVLKELPRDMQEGAERDFGG